MPKGSPRARIASAAIDVATGEPPAANSALCGIEHVGTAPHTAGETRRYDDNMIEILRDDLAAFAAAQSNDTRLSEAYRGQHRSQPLPDRPDRARQRSERRHRCALAPHLAKPD